MKVTHGRIANVYRAIMNISNNPLPVASSMAIYHMKNSIKEYVDFGTNYAVRTANEIGADVDENGHVNFKSAKMRGDFLKKMSELDNTEVDIDIKPVTVKIFPEMVISPNDIEILEGFIAFTE